jgi:hypothetical protein
VRVVVLKVRGEEKGVSVYKECEFGMYDSKIGEVPAPELKWVLAHPKRESYR